MVQQLTLAYTMICMNVRDGMPSAVREAHHGIGRFMEFLNVVSITDQKVIISKAIPLQARKGSGCSRRLRLPDFKTVGT